MTKQLSFRHTLGVICLIWIPLFGFGQLFEFKQNQQWGLIDQEGKIILPSRYDRIEASKDRTHFYLYKDGKTGVYHRYKGILSQPAFDHIFPLKQGYYIMANKGKYGIMDTLGKVLSPTKYDRFRQVGRYFYTYIDGKMGLIQPHLGELLTAKYDTIFRFEKKYFCSIENRLAGLIDTVGKLIEPANYHQIQHLFKDWYKVKFNGKWGMKKLGNPNLHYPIAYNYIGTFDREKIYLQLTQNNYSQIDDFQHQTIVDSIPGRLIDYFGDRYAYTRGKGLGLMTLDAKPLSKPVFARIQDVHPSFFQVTYKGNQGVIDREGKMVVYPRYDAVSVDSTKFVWAKVGKKWGVLSPEGKPVFPPTFDGPSSFQNHVAKVHIVKWDTLERRVRKRIEYRYEWVNETYYLDSTKFGLINQHGEYLAPIEYDFIKVYMKAARLKKYRLNNVSQIAFNKQGRKSNRFQLMIDSSAVSYNERKELERLAADTTQIAEADTIPDTFKWIRVKGKWGLQSEKEKIDIWKITPRYQFIDGIENTDLTLVGRKGRRDNYMLYGLVDHVEGKAITPLNYKKIYTEDFSLGEYVRVIESHNLFNIIHQSGSSAITSRKDYLNFWKRYGRFSIKAPPTYIGKLQDGWARVQFGGSVLEDEEVIESSLEKRLIQGGGRWGIMFFNGTFKLDPNYTYIGEPADGTFSFKQRKQWGIMDTALQQLIPPTYHLIEDYDGQSPLFIGTHEANKLSILNSQGKYENTIDLNNQTLIKDASNIQDVGILKEGMLAFKQGGRWGFFNSKGEVAIYPSFVGVGDFSNGLAKARTGRLWGYINTSGEFIIKEKYSRADDFHGGIAATNSSKGWKFIDTDGNRAIRQSIRFMKPFFKGKSIVKSVKSNKWGIIDTSGIWVLEAIYEDISQYEGYYRLRKDNKYGYVDGNLQEILPTAFDFLGEMREGKFHYRSKRKYGFMNHKGEEVIEPLFGVVQPFSQGRAATKERTTWGFIDDKGKVVIERKYAKVRPFSSGVSAVARKLPPPYSGLRWGFIDTTGRTVVPLIYRTVRQNKHGILSCYSDIEEWQYFDRYGIPLSHNVYRKASEYTHNLSEVEMNGLSYLMDLNTNLITNPGYHDILSWEDSQVLAISKERKGLLSRKGKEVLPFEYEQIRFFDGLYQIVNNGQVGYMNELGEWVWPIQE